MTDVTERLAELRELGLFRRTRMVSGPQGPRVVLDGRPVLLLCSNNYLGLADHPRVREAAADAAMRWGVGAGASRLVSGTMTVHRRLEERLASFEERDAALLFGSGYLANVGVVSALAGAGSVVLSDELNHASIVDGCRLARAETFVYRHADLDHLAWGLRNAEGRSALIVTDSVFSMDGDVAPLVEIVELARRHRVRVVVDEAHGTGCLGPGGRGAVHEAGVADEVDVVVGTLGKALGTYGAYAACDRAMAQLLLNTARPFVYSTGPSPPVAAGALAALELLAAQPERVDRLRSNAAALRDALHREGFDVAGSTTQIVPIVVGDARQAMRMCELAIEGGVFAQAIRPPTVPEGTSRLRLAVMASHSREELREAARVLGRAALRAGFRPGAGVPAVVAGDGVAGDGTAGDGTAGEGAARPFDAETDIPRAAEARGRRGVRGCFVTGTDTGVGKTVLAAAIVAALRARGVDAAAFKPVVTGLDDPEPGRPADHELLGAAAGAPPESVAPLRFGPPVSPHLAAELAGVAIEPDGLVAGARAAGARADALVVEGVGGLLVPLAADFSVRDLAVALGLPVVVAARPGLGTISHTLLTVEAARAAELDVRAVVLTPWPEAPSPMLRSNRETIARLGAVEVATLPEVGTDVEGLAAAGAALPVERWLGEAAGATGRAGAPGGAGAPEGGAGTGPARSVPLVGPDLRGERVFLRAPVEADIPALAAVMATPEVGRWWMGETEALTRERVLQGEEDVTTWVVLVGDDLIGMVQAWEQTEPEYRHAGIDIALHPAWHGQGLGAETVRTVARHLIDDRGHHRITIDPAASNERAIRSYERVGFRPVGVMREYERGADGSWHDGLLMDLLAADLR